ncbi:MAG: formate dehydrogenase subunit gamma [Rhodospirillales bacterium]|nr:formate dehydrogenase subunit gamma [Rhodospirillales bacterium]
MAQMKLAAMLGALFALVMLALPAAAQQPASVNPTAQSVNERKLLEALKPEFGTTAAIEGRGTFPDVKSRVLQQPAGRDWQSFRNGTLAPIGMYAILGMTALITLFYVLRGPVRISAGRSGRTILRFGSLDRFAHWVTATSFVALALTGLNITFGRALILPLVGETNFAVLAQMGKYVHNYVSFAFVLGIVLMFLLWTKDNLPSLRDVRWFAQGGGLVGLGHPPADRFNGGQKLIFWSTIIGGAALSISGYILMFPYALPSIGVLQSANVVHALAGVIMTAMILGHIYIGSLGMEGAFAAMGSGQVDVNWAKEHHSVWVEKVQAREGGKVAPAE